MNAFLVEKVDVSIGGEGPKATLIGWGDYAFCPNASKSMFPLRIGPLAQYNLLYAVAFMRSPEEMDAFSFARSTNPSATMPDLQRAVTINAFGKPYFPPPSTETTVLVQTGDLGDVSYPTPTFSSRWNCVLDLAAQQGPSAELLDAADPSGAYPSILPQAASPFPSYSTYSANAYYHGDQTPPFSATAGSKQFTLHPGSELCRSNVEKYHSNKIIPQAWRWPIAVSLRSISFLSSHSKIIFRSPIPSLADNVWCSTTPSCTVYKSTYGPAIRT